MFLLDIYFKQTPPLSPTLIKMKIKFSSYIRKFWTEQLQSHIWLTASSHMRKYFRIFSYIRKAFLINDLQLLHSEFPYCIYEENFYFLLLSVHTPTHSLSIKVVYRDTCTVSYRWVFQWPKYQRGDPFPLQPIRPKCFFCVGITHREDVYYGVKESAMKNKNEHQALELYR
jgi:hypothetical protein